MWAPRHYLEKWHIKYNPQAADLAKSEGFETWAQAFNQHKDKTQAQTDVNCPDISPWVLSQVDAQGNKYFDRNPYYFVVDKEGNQLPYIDQQIGVIVADAQVRTLKLASGELHAAAENPLPVKDYTLYKQNEAQGNYTTYLFDNTRGSDCSFTFNVTHKDPVLREIFNNVKFREAMSLAINRQQINEVLYFNRAVVRQAVPPANTSFMENWMNDYMVEYDVDEANQRLDEIGLKWNAAHTQRLRPDGRPFQIVLESTEEFTPMGEMVAEMWTAVGVKTDYKQNERTFARERYRTNERDAQCFTFDSVAEFALRSDPVKIRPPWQGDELGHAPLYREWYDTNGAGGMEPPQDIKDLRTLVDEWLALSPSNSQYIEKGKEMLNIFTRNLWYIGLTVAPRVVIISNKLGNTPTEGTFAGDYSFWYPFRGDSWYFK
jgi:peptide/nickel transport system substrate-binding protein